MASIYELCGVAARKLLADPEKFRIVTPSDAPKGIFTDLDVITLAAREASHLGQPWDEEDMRLAQREAGNYTGMLFRTGRIVRFGPVAVPDFQEPDYLRLKGRMIYAPPSLSKIKTPNGTFSAVTGHDDPITRQGRRLGTARNDLEPWSDQKIGDINTRVQLTPADRENFRLNAELEAAHERIQVLEEEVHRLRTHAAANLTKEDLVAAIQRLGEAA